MLTNLEKEYQIKVPNALNRIADSLEQIKLYLQNLQEIAEEYNKTFQIIHKEEIVKNYEQYQKKKQHGKSSGIASSERDDDEYRN